MPDSIGAGALAHVQLTFCEPRSHLLSDCHAAYQDIYYIDIAHKLRRTFFLKQFSFTYSYAVDSLNSEDGVTYYIIFLEEFPRIIACQRFLYLVTRHG